ncbi:MAG: cysteine--tRNA ligase [Candidatus Promineifilaceae bacterium]
MVLKLFDTFAREIREFVPLKPDKVRLYACGLTVYDYAHIGNLRTYIFEDILRRTLEYNGFDVEHVMNITDVGHLVSDADTGEDKMEKGSRRTGMSAWQIAELYTEAFKDDLNQLNIYEPTKWCKATDHIQEQIDLVRCIEENGYTYRTSDGIYFDTSKIDNYGYLARLDVEGLQAGSRIEVGEKRNATDFALWKFSPTGEQRQMEWESPWGVGFPGWHIECSAMAAVYLGDFFDIHCGGEDHIPVHHSNEIAQTQACYGTNLANFWMHGYFLQLDEAKMAKSSGGFLRLKTLVDKGYDPIAYRYFSLNAHYRSKLNFTWTGMDSAVTSLSRLRTAVFEWGEAGKPDEQYLMKFLSHINDDLNMPRALALTWDLVHSDLPAGVKKATATEFDKVLGLRLTEWEPVVEEVPGNVLAMVEQREQARAAKRWGDADALRDQIEEAGYQVRDTAEGPQVKSR